MDRRLRLIVALGVALVLATFMLYTAFAGGAVSEPVIEVQELAEREKVARSEVVELVGVAAGPVTGEKGQDLHFFVTDRRGRHRTAIDYSGSVPDAFRVGRHIIVKGTLRGSGGDTTFKSRPNTLVTKCPSKFESEVEGA